MIRRISGWLAALVVLAAGSVAADPYSAPGAYVFIGGLNGFEDFEDRDQTTYDDSLGFDARVGWRVNPYVAVELEGNFLSGFDVDVPTQGGEAKLSLDGGNFTVNLKGVLPLGRFQPYALVGIGGMWADLRTRDITGIACQPGFIGWWCFGTTTRIDNGGSFVAKFGGGTDFWVSEDFGLTMDATYVMPTGELEDIAYTKFSWGIKFKY